MKTQDSRPKSVTFADEKLLAAFGKLKTSTSEERKLYDLIDRALTTLRKTRSPV